MSELPTLGDHCSLDSCKTLDFLPIKCDLCNFKYCKEHSSYSSHNCTKFNDLNNAQTNHQPIPLHTCSLEGCKAKELIPIICEDCKLNYCVSHRLQIDHKCKNLTTQNTTTTTTKHKQNEFKFELKTNVSEKNANLASKLVIMKLRQTAVGPPGLPEESKLYCFIDYQNNKKPFYFSNKWPIGRCIEFLCNKFNIKSDNKVYLKYENEEIINTSSIVQELIDSKLFNHGITLKLVD